MRDYNFRKNAKEKEKQALYIQYNSHFCRPRSPRLQENSDGVEYIVEGNADAAKIGLKRTAAKKVRNCKDVGNGSNYKKLYGLTWHWY